MRLSSQYPTPPLAKEQLFWSDKLIMNMKQQLTAREKEIIHLVAAGNTDKEIGAMLGIKARTVSTHVQNFIKKLGGRNRTHAVAKFYLRI